jgi:hypothetical protein
MVIEKLGHEIRNVGQWLEFAPPKKGLEQWVEGRSALECTRSWCAGGLGPQCPSELEALLASLRKSCPKPAMSDRREVALGRCSQSSAVATKLARCSPKFMVHRRLRHRRPESRRGAAGQTKRIDGSVRPGADHPPPGQRSLQAHRATATC